MRYMLFLLAFLYAGSAVALEQKNRSYFFNCDRNDECILIEHSCPGAVTALNKQYVKEAVMLWKSAGSALECTVAKPKTKTIKAWCVQNKCNAY